MKRREFLAKTAATAAGTALGADALGGVVDNIQPTTSYKQTSSATNANSVLSLPKGGGAIKGIGESFQPNPFTGSGNFTVPIYTSPGRSGMQPQLSLQYSTGQGNGPFGLGWNLSVPGIHRKTAKGIPAYDDTADTFVLSGAEDLVPVLEAGQRKFRIEQLNGLQWQVYQYRPRVEGLHALIEFWKPGRLSQRSALAFWRVVTKDNLTSIYGCTEKAKFIVPGGRGKIFDWRLELTYDAKGNAIWYQYKKDFGLDPDHSPIPSFEAHRYRNQDNEKPCFQQYLKSIHYGNLTPFTGNYYSYLNGETEDAPDDADFLFTVLFDYGEHSLPNPIADEPDSTHTYVADECHNAQKEWDTRDDAFSNYRAGFEVRTYRICRRVLMFHQLPDYPQPILVRSTDFHHQPNEYNGILMLEKVITRGYRRLLDATIHRSEEVYLGEMGVISNQYAIKSFPPVTFKYSTFAPDQQRFQAMRGTDRDLPDKALSNPDYALVDLFGTGLPDVVHTSPGGMFYWKNKGEGQFDLRRSLRTVPNNVRLGQAGVGFGDMAGNGQADLLLHSGTQWGYFEANGAGGWKNFKYYKKQPSFDLNSPQTRLMDWDGSGKAGALTTTNKGFVYFPCEGEDGFGEPKYIRRSRDLDLFPDIDFSDPRVRLADMTGDGLNDIVLIHQGRVDYWANLGHGKFSRRITMANAPRLPYNMQPSQVILLDIDGSGSADLVYLEPDQLRFWFNKSGNSFSDTHTIKGVPLLTNPADVVAADMLGNGTNGLLLSRDYPSVGRSNYHFLDFSGGTKPNLLIEMSNSMGATTQVRYRPSTYYFLQDEKDRSKTNWVSTLPFPVQCVDRVEQLDSLSGTLLVTRYAYHHGYYDGKEREFRGFAFVEQFDTETIQQYQAETANNNQIAKNQSAAYRLPEVLTKTWFHTGAYQVDQLRKTVKDWTTETSQLDLHQLFRQDYFQGDTAAFSVAPARIDTNGASMDTYSVSEAWRTIRGTVLRKEVYALDERANAPIPYMVEESSYGVRLIQPKASNRHAVYQVLPQESLKYHYERVIENPRISQEITLKTDRYGNSTQAVAIAYPSRDAMAHTDQRKLYASLTETDHIQANEQDFTYRYHSIPYRSASYELLGLEKKLANGKLHFTLDQLRQLLLEAMPIVPYATDGNNWSGELSKRRLSQQLVFFKDSAVAEALEINPGEPPTRSFAGRLPLGEVDQLGLPYETYQMAFEEEMLESHFGQHLSQADRHFLLRQGGYLQLPEHNDNAWWAPSGQQSYASERFYLPTSSVDPWGYGTDTDYDDFQLLPVRSVDALGNETSVRNDYISLQVAQVRDENHNGTKVAFDALGMVQATATMGKLDENFQPLGTRTGDYLESFQTLWEYDTDYHQYLDAPFTKNPVDLIQDGTSIMLYDLWRNIRLGSDAPPAVWSASRESHTVDDTNVQQAILYFDALGRELQTKQEADPDRSDSTQSRRWLASGWKVYNNKGLVVRQYEPFYSNTPAYEGSREEGCSSTLFYDPLGRVICTIHPNHTYEKVVFDPWSQTTWDVNDTVDLHPERDEDVAPYVSLFLKNYRHCLDGRPYQSWKEEYLASGEDKKIKVVRDTLKHAATPTTTLLDVLGQSFLVLARNETEIHRTYSSLDIQGNERYLIDARQIEFAAPTKAFEHTFDLLQRKLVVNSMDAGLKKMLPDLNGEPLWSNDANGNVMIHHYDQLRRGTQLWVQELGQGPYQLKEATFFGTSDQALAANLKNKPLKVYDGAGLVENESCDFKGNILQSSRYVVRTGLAGKINWGQVPDGLRPGAVSIAEGQLNQNRKYSTTNTFDALNRIVETQLPDGTTTKHFHYNRLGQLFSVAAKWQDASGERQQEFIKRIDYNPKGQRSYIQYCAENGEVSLSTSYTYDEATYRLQRLTTRRTLDDSLLQDIHYSYDPVGNIIYLQDDAVPVVWSCGQRVDGSSYYQYDALYRLTLATGRKHRGITSENSETIRFKQKNRIPLPPPCGDQQALRWYTETYDYDRAGNLLEKSHYHRLPNNDGSIRGQSFWKIVQTYATDSNRLQTATSGNQTINYQHDANGNILNLRLGSEWNYANELISIQLDASGNKAYYYYDLQGNRLLKHRTDNQSSRIYLGDYEVYTRLNSTGRDSIHVMDDQNRIALLEIETSVEGNRNGTGRIRYQLSNHLGSATVEVDNTSTAQLICLEEYLPYGGTSISFMGDLGYSAKRYRYSGKERDEESGLYYYGARYYAPWVGRWVSCDPAGKIDSENLYESFLGNPINNKDELGLANTSTNTSTNTVPLVLTSTDSYGGATFNPDAARIADRKINQIDVERILSKIGSHEPSISNETSTTSSLTESVETSTIGRITESTTSSISTSTGTITVDSKEQARNNPIPQGVTETLSTVSDGLGVVNEAVETHLERKIKATRRELNQTKSKPSSQRERSVKAKNKKRTSQSSRRKNRGGKPLRSKNKGGSANTKKSARKKLAKRRASLRKYKKGLGKKIAIIGVVADLAEFWDNTWSDAEELVYKKKISTPQYVIRRAGDLGGKLAEMALSVIPTSSYWGPKFGEFAKNSTEMTEKLFCEKYPNLCVTNGKK